MKIISLSPSKLNVNSQNRKLLISEQRRLVTLKMKNFKINKIILIVVGFTTEVNPDNLGR